MSIAKSKKVLMLLLLPVILFAVATYELDLINFNSMEVAPQTTSADSVDVVKGQSIVSVVQSQQKDAKDIQYDEIKSMVENAVQLAGGFDGLIKNNSVVVVKPNLVAKEDFCLPYWSGRPLAPDVNGVTTDWRITKAIVELVREYNPDGKVYVMEGSSKPYTKDVMKHLKYTDEYIPGVDEFIALEEDSGAWQDFNSPKLTKVLLPDGLLHKEYYFNKRYYEADVIISVPCLKDHWHAAVTGGIKNVSIGASPANIYGISATDCGRNNMVDHEDPGGDLHKWIRDFYKCRPVDFVIMDGLQGIQNGPTPSYEMSGTSMLSQDQMNMRLILAGRDAIAVDTIESLIMNWDPEAVKYLKFLGEDGLGNLDVSNITVVGKKVDEVRKSFAGRIPPAGGAKVTDFEAPDMTVEEAVLVGSMLTLTIKADVETEKLEVVSQGGELLLEEGSSFDSIQVDLGKRDIEGTSIRVFAYDRFLNRSTVTLKIGKDRLITIE